jgi:type I restriction enzyme S subunit
MVIKEGYKQTEIGVIPNDWQIDKMSELTVLMTNGFVGVAKTHYTSYDNGVLYIQGYNVKENSFNFNGIKRVTEEFHTKNSKSNLRKGDLLTVQTGDVGLTTIVPKELEGSNCHALIISRFKKQKYNSLYFSYYLNSDVGRIRLKGIETGTTMKHINVGDLIHFYVPIPTLAEQTAIATALSDADGLITGLEKLIAKKRNIKQGAMQQLLQPKEGWEVKKLGELGKVYGGLSGKSKIDFHEGKYPYIPFMNIMSNSVIDSTYLDYVNIKNGEFQNQALKGDLFFNGSSETPEEVGMCSALLEDISNLYLNSFCFGYRLNKEHNADSLYLSYFFRSDEGRNLFYAMAQGATRYNLSKGNFLKLEIKLPKPEEQTRIASILSDMDAELSALEQKLEKYKKIKLGMMQELLTGKTRLI